jgi:glycosyltransferase 2 family protein
VSGAWALSFFIIVLGIIVKAVPGLENIAVAAFITATALYYFIIRRFFNKHIKRFAVAHALALLVQALQLFCVFFILLGLGYEYSKSPYLLIFLLSSFATLFPFTIGGLGAREIAIVWGASALLLDKDISVSMSLCFYVISALVSLLGTVFVFTNDSGKQLLKKNKREKDNALNLPH